MCQVVATAERRRRLKRGSTCQAVTAAVRAAYMIPASQPLTSRSAYTTAVCVAHDPSEVLHTRPACAAAAHAAEYSSEKRLLTHGRRRARRQ